MSLMTWRRSDGQALVEFAIVLPVLVLLLLALFDAGRGVLYYAEIANASRVAARVAIVDQNDEPSCIPDKTFKCAAADIAVATGISASSIDDLVITTVSGSDCSLPSNCTATVKVAYSFEPITPLVGAILGAVDLSASTTMPLERVYDSSTAP